MLCRSRKKYFTIVSVFGLLFLIAVGAQFVKVVRSDQFPEGIIVPTLSVISPQDNSTYLDQVPLTFILTPGGWEPGSVYSDHHVWGGYCGYSLDGEDNVFVGENTTLTGLSAGAHEIVLQMRWGIERQTFDVWTEIHFSVKVTEPFPTMLVVAFSAALAAVLALVILVYFKKLKRETVTAHRTSVWCFLKGVFRFRGTKYILIAAVILLLVIVLVLHSITPAADNWTMFHQGATRTGYSTSTAPNTNHIQWIYPAGASACSPAVVDDRVYTDSGEYFCCLNANTGDSIWNYTLGSGGSSSPAVADDRVYTAAWSVLYCLNATTGEFIWSYATGDWIRSSPAVAYGKVYIGSSDHKVYCLDAATGANIWNYTTGYSVLSSPAVAFSRVYVGSWDGTFYCLDASTGSSIWNFSALVRGSPAVADGRVYVGSEGGDIYCLESSTGGLIWSYDSGSAIGCSPAVAYGRVYAGNYDHYIFCLNAADGAFVWNYWTSDNIRSSPAVADGKVFAGSSDNKFYCLNAYTGEFIWSYSTGWDVTSSPAIANGKVYVGALNKVIAFG